MKIIVDNGGTKSDWWITEKEVFSTQGIDLFSSEKNLKQQFEQIFFEMDLTSRVGSIYFYSTGVNEITKAKILNMFVNFFPKMTISIFSDMLGASRALFKNETGIACILGTGSNCAYYDGEINHLITVSLGHIFGDQGGGYDLGKNLLIYYFNNRLSNDLEHIIEQYTQMSKTELLAYIYSIKNQKYYIASFSLLMKKMEYDLLIQSIIKKSILDFLENHPFQCLDFESNKFGFVGSVAFSFQNYIQSFMDLKNIECVFLEKPISKLFEFHQK